MQSFRHIGLKLWKTGEIQNRYPIVVYGVMSDSYSKNPRLLWYLAEMVQYIEYYVEGKNIRTTWLYRVTLK